MAKVTLDRDTFKALASETRLDVMRALDDRRKTGSELARELDLNKATVHEHLHILEATELVRRVDEGRKWVYWELTWSGTKLLHPEQGASFSILLGLSALTTGGGLAMLGRALGWWMEESAAPAQDGVSEFTPERADAEEDQPSEGMEAADAAMPAPEESMASGGFFDDGGWIALALLLTAVTALVLAVWLRRRS